jgi:hypothetical protein
MKTSSPRRYRFLRSNASRREKGAPWRPLSTSRESRSGRKAHWLRLPGSPGFIHAAIAQDRRGPGRGRWRWLNPGRHRSAGFVDRRIRTVAEVRDVLIGIRNQVWPNHLRSRVDIRPGDGRSTAARCSCEPYRDQEDWKNLHGTLITHRGTHDRRFGRSVKP